MKKIPCIFAIDHNRHETMNEINPKAEFIFDHPEARATIKKDGTAIMMNENGEWFARRSVNRNKKAPEGFIPAETDPITGKTFGWEPMATSSFHKAFADAMKNETRVFTPGTFELVGKSINGNPEAIEGHRIMVHGEENAEDFPSISEIAAHSDDIIGFMTPIFAEFKARGIEGVVWWITDENGVEFPAVKARVKDIFGDPNRR